MSMKRTNLYLAMVVAAGLVGCGSSSDGTTATTPEGGAGGGGAGGAGGANPTDVVNEFDPADTGANVGATNLRYTTNPTRGAQIWIKNTGSELQIGPSESNVEVTPVNSQVSLTSLANIVISRHGNPVNELRYAGQKWDDVGGIDFTSAKGVGGTIQQVNKNNVAIANAVNRDINALFNSKSAAALTTANETTGLVTIGQPGWQSTDGNRFFGDESDYDTTPTIAASAGATTGASTTRVFGRAYNTTVESKTGNAKIVPGTNPSSTNFSGIPTVDNSYSNATLTLTAKGATTYKLEAVPMKLQRVQYGRVTVNMNDAATTAMNQSIQDGAYNMRRIPFANKGAANTVDSYFVRGMGDTVTTLAQMQALPSEGVYGYRGHALMYGLDNSDHRGANAIPNGGGFTSSQMVGNLVQLDFNLGTRRVENGQVYNIWQDDPTVAALDNTRSKDILVNFSGDVVGNTIIGTADRAYVAGNDNNAFTGTFYGPAADEVGGAFGINRSTRYSTTVGWGGVFGAKKTGSGSIAIDAE